MLSTTLRLAARPAMRHASVAVVAPTPSASFAMPARRSFASTASALKVTTRFTSEHEWIQFDDATNVGTIGVTDYAQKSLGDVVYVELPSEGTEVGQGEQIGAVESVKAASDIYSPVTGQVKGVNEKLNDEPGLLNKSPEKDGWLCKILLTKPTEFEELLDEEAYKKLTQDD